MREKRNAKEEAAARRETVVASFEAENVRESEQSDGRDAEALEKHMVQRRRALEERERGNLREASYRDFSYRMRKFATSMGERLADELTVAAIKSGLTLRSVDHGRMLYLAAMGRAVPLCSAEEVCAELATR